MGTRCTVGGVTTRIAAVFPDRDEPTFTDATVAPMANRLTGEFEAVPDPATVECPNDGYGV